jgi:hypothetical protein
MSEQSLRIGLLFFGVVNLLIGLTQLFTPHWFFDNIGPYGVRNDHYLGDVGAFYVAAGGALLMSIQRPSWRAPLLYMSAAWYALHAANHLFDIGEDNKGDGRGIADTVSLAIGAGALLYLARFADRESRRAPPPSPGRGLPPRPADYPPGD